MHSCQVTHGLKSSILEAIMDKHIESISVIVPILNEQENILILTEKIRTVCHDNQYNYEIIFVNDGSTDDTGKIIEELAHSDSRIKTIHLKRNFGQTAALMAGLNHAQSDIFITMDADLQNDPADIPQLLSKLHEGYDLVSGWRKERLDHKYKRVLISKSANWLISKLSGVSLSDYGCTLKAYKKEIFDDVKLYGEMHRFIPIYASWSGAKIAQIPVNHHKRLYGKSHYGLERTFKVLLDLIVILFFNKYAQKPIYIFGGFGILSFFLGFLTTMGMFYLKYFEATSFIQTPLPIITVLFIMLGSMSILLGIIAEVLMRTYYESQQKTNYSVRKSTNIK